ncbi:phosphotransferase [Nitrincola sp.]|uniref:phosphotransferase n=1 Tax=Nitrincola sp. TaxID=1926584 RepID=UPI003A946781
MTSNTATTSLMTQAAPSVDPVEAQAVLREHYGLMGTLERLPGERDSNFCLSVSCSKRYMVRFINAAEADTEIDFQTQMLIYLQERAAHLPLPSILKSLSGECQPRVRFSGQVGALRVVSYLEGMPFYQQAPFTYLARQLGGILGKMDHALADFSHPGAQRELLWDITYPQRLLDRIHTIDDAQLRKEVAWVIDRHAERVVPLQAGLPWQVIHNDLNPHNVLVDTLGTRITGIIDFGDALYAPRVNNLATALSYQLVDESDPLRRVGPFLNAYLAQQPLTDTELSLLADLVATRLCLTLTISSWRAQLYPENRDYILRNLPHAGRSLMRLRRLPEVWVDDLLNPVITGVSDD